ncbi:MAG: transporter [Armatimonadota bacterium]
MKTRYTANTYSIWFVLVVALFITVLLISNIIASKIATIGSFSMAAGIVIFPISYIVADVLTEVYGYRHARRVIWLGFLCNLILVVAIALAIWLPPAPLWDKQEAYAAVLGVAPRLLVASLIAYLFGEFTNSFVLAKMKILTRGRWLWTRTIGSTFVGQLVDTAVFSTIAFAGLMPTSALATMIIVEWLFKTAYEALATPITYVVVGFLKRVEGVDAYDIDTNFSPFAIE